MSLGVVTLVVSRGVLVRVSTGFTTMVLVSIGWCLQEMSAAKTRVVNIMKAFLCMVIGNFKKRQSE